MKKVLQNTFWVLLLAMFLLAVPKLSGVIAGLFDYHAIDPDGSYAWLYVHHIVQALIFLAVMLFLSRSKGLSYGFGWGNKEVGMKMVRSFMLYFSIYTAVAYLIIFLTRSFQPFGYPLTAVNITGYMSFQLLLSGPSEELIFRAFAITMLALVIKGRVLKGRVSIANILAAVIFGLAHVGFTLAPFTLNYSGQQVVFSIALGLFYGDCYEKSKSMYYPMIMHSFSNVVMVGFTIIGSLIIG
jgi:uncharacterized protein